MSLCRLLAYDGGLGGSSQEGSKSRLLFEDSISPLSEVPVAFPSTTDSPFRAIHGVGLGVVVTSAAPAESASPATSSTGAADTVDEELRAAFVHAQTETIAAVVRTVAALDVGMSELDIARRLEAEVADRGFVSWFQRPRVLFGAPVKPRLRMSEDQKLAVGTIVEIDLAPANADAFGDFTTTVAFGVDEEPKIVTEARDLCRATCGFASRWKCTGELFVFADAWSTNHQGSLGDADAIGHVCLPRRGRSGWVWPYAARAAIQMRRHQVHWFNHRRMHGFYAIAPRLVQGDRACGFGEMVYVDGGTRMVVGRDSGAELGFLPAD